MSALPSTAASKQRPKRKRAHLTLASSADKTALQHTCRFVLSGVALIPWPVPRGAASVADEDQFKHLCEPAVQPGHLGEAPDCWDTLSRERDAYAAGVEKELICRAKAASA
jgi:hypothetical protein